MKARLIKCECGRNLIEDTVKKSMVMMVYALWCSSCGRRRLVDDRLFESGTFESLRTVNQIDWQAHRRM